MKRTYTLLLTTICAIVLLFSSCSNESFSSLQRSNELTLANAEEVKISPVEVEAFTINESSNELAGPVATPIEIETEVKKTITAHKRVKEIKDKIAEKSRSIVKAPVLASKKITASEKADKKANALGLLGWALVFLIIAIVAAVLGFGALSATAATIAQVLFIIFLVVFALLLIMHLLG